MRAAQIEELLSGLGCDRVHSASSGRGPIVRSTCPLAFWKHSGARDKKPSFAVFVADRDASYVRCLACGFKGDLNTLVLTVQKRSGRDLSKMWLFVQENDRADLGTRLEKKKAGAGLYSIPEETVSSGPRDMSWNTGPDLSDLIAQADAIPVMNQEHSVHVDRMISCLNDESLEYLKGSEKGERRLTDETIARWQLGWHPGARRIGIPQYDRNERLVNLSGRYLETPFDQWEPPKWMHARNFRKEYFLFGEDKFEISDKGDGTAFVVEGMFDAVYLDQEGIPNVGAMCGAFLSKFQCEKFVRWFDHLVVIPDGDIKGYEAKDRILESVGSRISVSWYETPMGTDPDELSDKQISEIKNRFLS
jgi:hypothetical protein